MSSTSQLQPPASPPDQGPGLPRWRQLLRDIREALAGGEFNFTEGSLTRAITILAIPMVLEMVMESLFVVCDLFFVSQVSDAALTAVALTDGMMSIIYSIAMGVAMGTTALVARRMGEKNPRAAADSTASAICLAFLLSLAIGIPAALYSGTLLRWMGASEEVIGLGTPYTAIMLGSNVVIVLLFVNNAAFRGAGDASISMRSLWIANAINIALDPCLIFGLGPFPELGLTGAAVATCIGRGTGVVYQFYRMFCAKGRLTVDLKIVKVSGALIRRLMRLSTTGTFQMLVATASYVVLVRIIQSFGDDAGASYNMAIRLVMFAILPAFGLSNAAATLVGQNLGAGKPERAEKAVWLTGIYNMIFLGFLTVLFLTTSDHLIAVFTKSPDIAPLAVRALKVISYGYVFYAWEMVSVQAFNGSGDTVTPIWINIGCFWVVEVPLAYLLAHTFDMGPEGAFWAIAIAYSLSGVVGVVLFRRGRWKKRMV